MNQMDGIDRSEALLESELFTQLVMAVVGATPPEQRTPPQDLDLAGGVFASPIELSSEESMARTLVQRLLLEAYANGFQEGFEIERTSSEQLSGGMATEIVMRTRSQISIVAKVDHNAALIAQASTLQQLAQHHRLGPLLKGMLPKVYAVHADGPPYAYIMEDLKPRYTEFHHLLRDKRKATQANAVLTERMMMVYTESVDDRLIPSVDAHYVKRIDERLADSRKEGDSTFNKMLDGVVYVNGRELKTWVDMKPKIEAQLRSFIFGKSTFVHGDLHPLNIFVNRRNVSELKLIDPKDWVLGDYLFDIGKMVHYLDVTFALDAIQQFSCDEHDDAIHVRYDLPTPTVAAQLSASWRGVARSIAEQLGDAGWEQRLNLSVAANLLGLPPSRLQRKLWKEAVISYTEGMLALEGCL